jgi:hypothetical protein
MQEFFAAGRRTDIYIGKRAVVLSELHPFDEAFDCYHRATAVSDPFSAAALRVRSRR